MLQEIRSVKTSDKITLNVQICEISSPVWIVAVHGIGEHLGRHNYLTKLFSQYFNICQFDLRGHGKSEGRRAYVNSFSDYYEDLDTIINYLQKTYRMDKYILFGHSMGALIVSGYLQKKTPVVYPARVFLNAPPVSAPGILGKILSLAPLNLTRKLKELGSIPLSGLVDLTKLSHDVQIYDAYINDPLCSQSLQSKLLLNLVHEAKEVFSRPLRIRSPLFVSYGSSDIVVDVTSLKNYFTLIEKNAQLFLVKDSYHEIHNEIDKYKLPYFAYLKTTFLETLYGLSVNNFPEAFELTENN